MATVLAEFRAQYDTGADPATVLTDLADFTHFVTRLRYVPAAAGDASLTEDERKRGAALADTLSIRVLSRAWQMLLKGITEVQSSNRPVAAAEMVLIRLAHAADLPTLDEAMRMLDDAPQHLTGNGDAAGPFSSSGPTQPAPARSASPSPGPASAPTRMPQSAGGGARLSVREPAAEAQAPPVVHASPEPVAETVPVRSLSDIAALADANRDMAFKVLLKRFVRPVRIEPGRLEVALTADAPKTLLNDLSIKLKNWTNRQWLVSLSREEGGRTLAQEETARRETAILDASNDPTVAAILSRFPGAKIIDVRIPDAPELPGIGDPGAEAVSPDPSFDDDDN
jgi:DNA polymerase-3 subunit gamma/tau